MDAVLYVHGKNGKAEECEHYKPLFTGSDVFGLDYKTFTPWDTGEEIRAAVEDLKKKYDRVIIVANSIGAFFTMNAGVDRLIKRAYFISPIVDMEKLILDMMAWNSVTEAELNDKGIIKTSFGEDLCWDYLCYVRAHPIKWKVLTHILYGDKDELTSLKNLTDFVENHNATLTVLKGGEHWFHTEEQMAFLDNWIMKNEL